MCPQGLVDEVAVLVKRGVAVEAVEANGQCYALAPGLPAPVPPWDKDAYDILVAIPAADGAALDAFYLALPYKFNGGIHPRVNNGGIITVKDRQWQLVSWHYADGKAWVRGQDDLASHLVHCKGFFLNRGATNAA